MTERLYTREEAVIIGRRDICHSDDNGHDIEQHRVRQADGQLVINTLKCTRCDVVLTPSYPELGEETAEPPLTGGAWARDMPKSTKVYPLES